jgi:hypothetical protein
MLRSYFRKYSRSLHLAAVFLAAAVVGTVSQTGQAVVPGVCGRRLRVCGENCEREVYDPCLAYASREREHAMTNCENDRTHCLEAGVPASECGAAFRACATDADEQHSFDIIECERASRICTDQCNWEYWDCFRS